ncbi:reverse transcriptase domain-containing protein [Tanacetum coccineum]
MLVDALLHHEMKGRVDRLVEEVEQTGKGGGRTGDQGGQGNEANGGINKVPDFATVIAQQLQDLLPTIVTQVGDGRNGCSYKDFVACKPKEFNGKGGKWNSEVRTRGREAAVGMTCEDFKALMKEEYCPSNEMQKLETEFWNHTMVGAGHSAYTNQFYELARLVPHLVTPETKRIERYIYGLAPQILRNGSLKRSGVRRGDGVESSKEGNVKDDNKRAGIRKVFTTFTNLVRKEYMGSAPRCTSCNFHHNLETPCCMCTNCNRLGHFAKDYKVGPRMVNPLNDRNPKAAREACYEYGSTDHYKSACPRLNRGPG